MICKTKEHIVIIQQTNEKQQHYFKDSTNTYICYPSTIQHSQEPPTCVASTVTMSIYLAKQGTLEVSICGLQHVVYSKKMVI